MINRTQTWVIQNATKYGCFRAYLATKYLFTQISLPIHYALQAFFNGPTGRFSHKT